MEEKKAKYIDLNYEEVSSDRDISNGAWGNGLHTYRVSISPGGGNCIIPSMSYFQVEYNFGSMDNTTDKYTAVKALQQSKKIVLQNNFMACAYTAARYTCAGAEVGVINSSYAQMHTLKRRMGMDTVFMEHLGGDLNGYDPDFSRRLARTCEDGVWHRDGIIDVSPYASQPLSSNIYGTGILFSQSEKVLVKNPATGVFTETLYDGKTDIPTAGNYNFAFLGEDGEGPVPFGSGAGTNIRSFLWKLGPYSSVPGATTAINDAIVDGNHFNLGDKILFRGEVPTLFDTLVCTVVNKKASGNTLSLVMRLPEDLKLGDLNLALGNSINPKLNTGIVSYSTIGGVDYTQPDPRSNTVNNVIMHQPCLSFFDITRPDVFFGNLEFTLTPNSNWANACVESSTGGFYNTDIKHGIDYAFGIKSVRLYIARARLLTPPPSKSLMTVADYQISNKQITGSGNIINFSLPPSTYKIVCFLQDAGAGNHSMLPLTRFKSRQDTFGVGLDKLSRYGPFAKDFSERLQTIQLNFGGITKPLTNFQRGSGAGSVSDPTTNNMLQRWVMTNQNLSNRLKPEKYTDWLGCGPFYAFDYTRDSSNQGTFLTVNITYDGVLPTDGSSATSGTPANLNLYVVAMFNRDVSISYDEYGNIVSVATQQR